MNATAAAQPDHAGRRARIRARLDELEVDALVVTHAVDVRWLTGFTGSNGQVLLGRRPADDLLVTDGRYAQQAADQVPGMALLIERSWVTGLAEAVSDLTAVGVQADHLPWATVAAAEQAWRDGPRLTATTGVLAEARQVKDDVEIAILERACDVTDRAYAWLCETITMGRAERDLAVALERTMVDLGADGRAFRTILASGPNSAIPHHEPGDRVLQSGDLVKVDFGALVDGYHADMTRVIALGEVRPALVELHGHVAQAQELGVAAAVVGAAASDVDATCRDHLASVGLGDRFVHGTGHGVGLEIHELPAVGQKGAATLAEGMTITVEPGAYLPGEGGVRIEDTLVVTASGPRRLTRSPRELIVV